MTGLDQHSVHVVAALVVLAVTVLFAATTVLRHFDETNRIWTSGFVAASAATSLPAVWGRDSTVPDLVTGASGAAMTLALGAWWAGTRMFAGRLPRRRIVAATVVLAAAVPLLPFASTSVGMAVGPLLAGCLAWSIAVELGRGPMRQNVNSRLLQLATSAFALWSVVVAALQLALDDDSTMAAPGGDAVALALAVLAVVTALCLSTLRVERFGNWWTSDEDTGPRTPLGVLGPAAFRSDCQDRIDRTSVVGGHITLVVARLDDLAELNTAFGRDAGDAALAHMGGILRTHVSAAALIGHLGGGVFGVLTVTSAPTDPAPVVAALRNALADQPVPAAMEMRLHTSFGSSTSERAAHDLDALLADAQAELTQS